MTENEAREVMERATDRGAPIPNIVEYSEALRKADEILGRDYTEEQLHNWLLCGKYPFLVPRYDWSQEIVEDYDYTSTYLDDIPVGWKKAFGEMMCEEIKQELVRCNYLDEFRIVQAKEKYGQLIIYTNGEPIGCKVQQIIDKYSVLSENICIICGKPDVPMTHNGWDSPYCKECFTAPADWYKKEYPNEVDEWIKNHIEDWEEYNKEENNKMRDSYTVIRWSKDKGEEKVTYDVSETANKIRSKWRAEYGERDSLQD